MLVFASNDFVVFFLDLETSGLDVLQNEVLEIAITAHLSSAHYKKLARQAIVI